MKRTKGFLLLVMMLLGLYCLSGPSWAEAACPEGEPQQSYTGSLLITAKEGDADSQSGVNPLATFEGDGGTVKLDHIGSGILRWQVLPDKIANDPFSFAGTDISIQGCERKTKIRRLLSDKRVWNCIHRHFGAD